MGAKYILRFDDIAPNANWAGYHRLKAALIRFGVRPVIGVIPDNHDPELLREPLYAGDFWQEIRQVAALGWEVAIHGHQHLYETTSAGMLGINARSEFAGLPYGRQLEKLKSACATFEREGLRRRTFMPPSHTFDDNTLKALREVGIKWITDGYGLYPYCLSGLILVPQLLARPRPMPVGVHTYCMHLNTMDSAEIDTVIRFIELHHAATISFEESVALVNNGWLNGFSRIGLGAGLKTMRWARRALA